jgi:hypothetical protein
MGFEPILPYFDRPGLFSLAAARVYSKEREKKIVCGRNEIEGVNT